MENKRLLLLTGPQGSGNHLFSRILSMHPAVKGWEDLKHNYWVPSDEEPFAEYWIDPESVQPDTFEGADYFLANVSCPFFYDGQRRIPKIREFADRVASLGIDVTIAIVTRDQNINRVQQKRVGGVETLPNALDYYRTEIFSSGYPVNFIDHEALFLYGRHYLRWLSQVLGFPIAYESEDIFKFIEVDANQKYVTAVEEHWLDEVIRAGRKSFAERSIKS